MGGMIGMITTLTSLSDISKIVGEFSIPELAALINPGYGGVIAALLGA